MRVSQMGLVDGELREVTGRTISQSQLTSECWSVQFWGLEHCEDCKSKDKRSCGGKGIRKTGKNENGFEIPLGEEGL